MSMYIYEAADLRRTVQNFVKIGGGSYRYDCKNKNKETVKGDHGATMRLRSKTS